MTDLEYKNLIDRIVNREVNPPTHYTVKELMAYLNGYTRCQNEIINIIKKQMEGQK